MLLINIIIIVIATIIIMIIIIVNFSTLMFTGHYSVEGKLPPVASGLKNFSPISCGAKEFRFL